MTPVLWVTFNLIFDASALIVQQPPYYHLSQSVVAIEISSVQEEPLIQTRGTANSSIILPCTKTFHLECIINLCEIQSRNYKVEI